MFLSTVRPNLAAPSGVRASLPRLSRRYSPSSMSNFPNIRSSSSLFSAADKEPRKEASLIPVLVSNNCSISLSTCSVSVVAVDLTSSSELNFLTADCIFIISEGDG